MLLDSSSKHDLTNDSWDLNTKLLPTVWQGLANSTVTKLKIRFPPTQNPKPIALAPPLPVRVQVSSVKPVWLFVLQFRYV